MDKLLANSFLYLTMLVYFGISFIITLAYITE